jgi:hypothetical protein
VKPLIALGPALLALLVIPACREAGQTGPWLGDVTVLSNPAGAGSRYPHLASTGQGQVVLSWLQALPQDGFALQHATWAAGAWSAASTVATGQDWFINWADFPSVVPIAGKTWAAHWLQQKPGSVYAYDVSVAISHDAGVNWSEPTSPHDDGTPTEHGFVSLYPVHGATQAVWLDGRHTSGAHDHSGAVPGAMTLRGATIGADGRRAGVDQEIDARVCDCCQTDVAITSEGPVIVYRDRSAAEVRDVALVRRDGERWSQPVQVHADGWKIDACPVNGPAVDARGQSVAVAWFTAPDVPRVRLALSDDGGRTFAPPVEVASGNVVGRVDVVLLEDGRAIVSWLQSAPGGAEIRAQPFRRQGAAGSAVTIAGASVQRASGFPQMVQAADGLLFAWTDSAGPVHIRTAFARLD